MSPLLPAWEPLLRPRLLLVHAAGGASAVLVPSCTDRHGVAAAAEGVAYRRSKPSRPVFISCKANQIDFKEVTVDLLKALRCILEFYKNVPLVEELLKCYKAIKAEMGVRDPPDMFLKEKGRISKYNMKLSSSDSNLNKDEKVQAQLVYESAQRALDLASTVMMVRTYATIFCNVAEAAYHQKIEMETTLSFLGALRGLGAIGHIMVQDTMAKLKDGRFKNTIICYMDKHSEEFVKMVKNLEDETAENKSWQAAIGILLSCEIDAEVYILKLRKCHRAALDRLARKE